jgi:DNA polymerase III delta prime subunit
MRAEAPSKSRKEKKPRNENKSEHVFKIPAKRAKTETTAQVINQPANEVNWLTTFKPKTIDDLLTHPKKLEEIKKWFLNHEQNSVHHILLLIGPSGCGKLSSIRVVGQEAGFDICEFDANDVNVDRELLVDDGDRRFHQYETQADKFSHFLFTSSRFQSLVRNKERLMVVKDFPNAFMRKGGSADLWAILKSFKARSNAPVVFIVTDSNSKALNYEYTLFPENVRFELGISTIK